MTELEELKANFSSNYDLKKQLVTELEKEMQDFKQIQQNTMHELDTTNNEINDLNYNIRMAYNKLSGLQAKKQYANQSMGNAIDTVRIEP